MQRVTDLIAARAALQPDADAVVELDAGGTCRRLPYAALGAAIRRGHELRRSGRVLPGDRVAMVCPDGIDFVLQGLEIMASGACFFPVIASVRGSSLEALTHRVRAHHVVEDGVWRSQADVGPVDGQGDMVFRSLEPAFMRFTSGTTHANKGVILGQRAVVERIHAANRGLGIGPGDRVLWVLPMAHHWVVSILLYLVHGATVLVAPGGPSAAFRLAVRERATVAYAAPHDLARLAQAAEGGTGPRPPLRLVVSTASGLTPTGAEQIRAGLGLPPTQALGLIEVGLPLMNLHHAAAKPLSVGRPLPDYQVWLREDDGRRLTNPAPGQAGEICIAGPGRFDAYLDPWRLAPRDFFATGDLGFFDDDGDLHILGRRGNRITRGGMKFFCEEVEQALERHPAVRACRVRAQPDPAQGEVPIAELELRPGAPEPTPAEVAAFLSAWVPPHMIPAAVESVPAIPRTATGKVRRW